jgi:hypothetical protein
MQRVESFCDSVPITDDRGGHTETQRRVAHRDTKARRKAKGRQPVGRTGEMGSEGAGFYASMLQDFVPWCETHLPVSIGFH